VKILKGHICPHLEELLETKLILALKTALIWQ